MTRQLSHGRWAKRGGVLAAISMMIMCILNRDLRVDFVVLPVVIFIDSVLNRERKNVLIL